MKNNAYFENMTCIGEVCSNFDRVIDEKIVQQLKEGEDTFAVYPCRDCSCEVWYDKEKQQFGCLVWCFGIERDEFFKDSVEEIRDYVCAHWSEN